MTGFIEKIIAFTLLMSALMLSIAAMVLLVFLFFHVLTSLI